MAINTYENWKIILSKYLNVITNNYCMYQQRQ